MPAKPKAVEPRWQSRMAAASRRHPVFTWTSVGAICGVLATISPAIWYVAHYYDPVTDAVVRDAKLRSDLAAMKVDNARIAAWNTVALMQMSVTVARNRVNDCDVKEDKRETMTALERQACGQYHDDFRNATQRFEDARHAALTISGGG